MFAQYKSGIGVKGNWYKLGLNYKVFVNDSSKNALDLELDFQETGFEFIGLYNWQVPFKNVSNLYWYYGVGLNMGRWDNDVTTQISAGIDAQIGIEFVPQEIPIVFSIDYTPNFSVGRLRTKSTDATSSVSGFWGRNIALGVKYVFGKTK